MRKVNLLALRAAVALDAIFQWKPAWLRPSVMVPVLAAVFLVCTVSMLHRTVTERVEHAPSITARGDEVLENVGPVLPQKKVFDPEMKAHHPRLYRMVHMGDSAGYLAIARIFSEGDFSCSYVVHAPHRQPLYPLLLAIPQWLTGFDPFWFGWVNVLAGVVLLLLFYQSSLSAHRNVLIAACAALFCLTNGFLMEEITGRIMTEPLFVLFCVGAIHCFLQYVEHRRRLSLLGAFGLLALSYLTRPNGLFLMGAMTVAICLGVCVGGAGWASRFGRARRTAVDLALAFALFAVIAFPSWLPRLVYLHNPISHGYLGNFMWVDTYAQGHTGLAYQSFHFADYVRTHSWGDFLARWGHGLSGVFGEVPGEMEGVPFLFLLAAVGAIAAVVRRHRAYCLLLVFFMVEMLPLIWTNLSNPNDRVPYSAMVPFELFFAVFALQTVADWAARVKARRNGSPEGVALPENPQGIQGKPRLGHFA